MDNLTITTLCCLAGMVAIAGFIVFWIDRQDKKQAHNISHE